LNETSNALIELVEIFYLYILCVCGWVGGGGVHMEL